jgi:hypothetical protein
VIGAFELGSLSYAQVEALLHGPAPTIALVPAGSTEAHGPHLPLSTDSIISEEMARRAAAALARRGYCAVRFPTAHYAVSGRRALPARSRSPAMPRVRWCSRPAWRPGKWGFLGSC